MKSLPHYKLQTFLCAVMAVVAVGIPSFAVAISLDPSFGTGGKFTLDFGTSGERTSYPFRIFQQSSGRLVLAGDHWTGGSIPTDFGIAMCGITQLGQLDSSFGSAGTVLDWNTPNFPRTVLDLQMLPNGKFLRLEMTTSFMSNSAALVRLNSNGTQDAAFSANIDVAGDQVRPWKISVHPNGKIYVIVGQFNGSSAYWLVRLNENGSRDSSFGSDGVRPLNLNRLSRFELGGMIVLEDGRILLGGSMSTGQAALGANVIWMARFDENGYLDRSFGMQGIVRREFATRVSSSKMLVQPDGKYLLIGSSISWATESKLLLMRLTRRGRPDPGFGINGVVESNVASTTPTVNLGYGGVLLSDGRIFVVGSSSLPPSSQSSATRFLIARFSASGILEDHTITEFSKGLRSGAFDAVVQQDDKLVVSGFAGIPGESANASVFAAARYIP